jgi:hypothetical protein
MSREAKHSAHPLVIATTAQRTHVVEGCVLGNPYTQLASPGHPDEKARLSQSGRAVYHNVSGLGVAHFVAEAAYTLLHAYQSVAWPLGSRRGCWLKKRTISAEASGPLGSVYEPEELPPDHACPSPWTVHRSAMACPPASR